MSTPNRMNPLDVWFLDLEDHCDQLHIGSVGLFEGPAPQYAELLDLVERQLPAIPRYRQRVRRVPFELARPEWVDDAAFSLERHVQREVLPAPGTARELNELVGRLMSEGLDHDHPLWQMWLIEGLGNGRWAVLSKIHHSLVDGVAGTDLMGRVLSARPDDRLPAWRPWRPEGPRSAPDLVRSAVSDRLEEAENLVHAAAHRALHPIHTGRRIARDLKGASQLLDLVHMAPKSSLTGPIGRDRRWCTARVERDAVAELRRAFSATHNDVVLALITRGFRDLLRERHELDRVTTVRSLVPVSIRPEDARGQLDNRVAALFAALPVSVADPIDRLTSVQAEMARLKFSGEDDATGALITATGLAPPWATRLLMGGLTRTLQRFGQRLVHTVTTNVPGPPVPLYLLGRRMNALYPYVPIAEALRIGIAVYTYGTDVTFGITGDRDTTPDLDVVARGIEDAMEELLHASHHRRDLLGAPS